MARFKSPLILVIFLVSILLATGGWLYLLGELFWHLSTWLA